MGKPTQQGIFCHTEIISWKETAAPVGYTSGGTITRDFQIREDGKIVQMNASDTAIKNEVIRGGVAVEKWDSELDQRVPQGEQGWKEPGSRSFPRIHTQFL